MRLITFEHDRPIPFSSGSVSAAQQEDTNRTDEHVEDERPTHSGTESQHHADANQASGTQGDSSMANNVNLDKSQGCASKGISTAVNTAEDGKKKTLG